MVDAWGLVVAAGSGSRFGGTKQFAVLAGKPVVEWSVSVVRRAVGKVVLVLPAGSTERAFGADVVVEGGATRSASVRNGLAALPRNARVVVIHDAARPLAGEELFRRVLRGLAPPDHPGVVCAVPVTDTLKRVDRSFPEPFPEARSEVPSAQPCLRVVTETIDRETLVSVQTPQAFDADVLRRAHSTNKQATDDAALVEAIGARVRVVPGDPQNIKVTSRADLVYLEHLLRAQG